MKMIVSSLLLCLVASLSRAAVIDQRPNQEAVQMETTIDDLMNVLAQVTKLKDELRCHCNLPVCVTTGYMCKSAMGTCFSEIVDRSDLSKSRHGCLELITSSDQSEAVCHHHHQSTERRQHHKHQQQQHQQHQRPTVLCCQDDLCNYGAQQVQLMLLNSAVQPTHRSNESSPSTSSGGLELLTNSNGSGGEASGAGNGSVGHDLWLKAATIAVPIAGGCILVLLVLLAIRMLRRDRENGQLDNSSSTTGYALANECGDFQIRSVWNGKSHQPTSFLHQQPHNHSHQIRQSKDRQPMLPHQQYRQFQHQQQRQQHCHQMIQQQQHHNLVYLPTVHKMAPPKTRMWNMTKNPAMLHHV